MVEQAAPQLVCLFDQFPVHRCPEVSYKNQNGAFLRLHLMALLEPVFLEFLEFLVALVLDVFRFSRMDWQLFQWVKMDWAHR